MSENTFIAPVVAVLSAKVNDANAIATEIKTATSVDKDAVKKILSESDDSEIVTYRKQRAKYSEALAQVQAKLKDLDDSAKSHARTLMPGVSEDFDLETKRDEFLAIRKTVTESKKFLLSILGNDKDALDALLKDNGIAEVINISGSSKSGNVTGIKRPRIVSATIDGENFADKNGKVSFTTLAKELSADVNVIKDAAFKAAGTDDFTTIPGEVVSFAHDGKNITVTAKPVE